MPNQANSNGRRPSNRGRPAEHDMRSLIAIGCCLATPDKKITLKQACSVVNFICNNAHANSGPARTEGNLCERTLRKRVVAHVGVPWRDLERAQHNSTWLSKVNTRERALAESILGHVEAAALFLQGGAPIAPQAPQVALPYLNNNNNTEINNTNTNLETEIHSHNQSPSILTFDIGNNIDSFDSDAAIDSFLDFDLDEPLPPITENHSISIPGFFSSPVAQINNQNEKNDAFYDVLSTIEFGDGSQPNIETIAMDFLNSQEHD